MHQPDNDDLLYRHTVVRLIILRQTPAHHAWDHALAEVIHDRLIETENHLVGLSSPVLRLSVRRPFEAFRPNLWKSFSSRRRQVNCFTSRPQHIGP